MSNNIYDILGKINSVAAIDTPAEEVKSEPVYESVEPRGSITEAVKSLEERFKGFKDNEYEPAAPNPEAIAKRKHLQALKDKQEAERAERAYSKEGPRTVKGRAYGGSAQADEPEYDLDEDAKPDFLDLDKDGDTEEPMKDAAKDAEPAKADPKKVSAHKRLQALKDKTEDEGEDWWGKEKESNVRTHKGSYGNEYQGDDVDEGWESGPEEPRRTPREHDPDWADHKRNEVAEVAPPGAKAERMVKHIKAGYAKDGKLTKKEKGIAYATAWKAHNKGQVEEGVEFKDTIKNSEAKLTKAKLAKVSESRVMEETDYFYEKVAKALAEKNPTLNTASPDFVTAVRQEMVAQGIEPNRARNIITIDDDFISDVATSYGHYCKEIAECGAPMNSFVGGMDQELDEISRLAGLPVEETEVYNEVNVEESPDTMDEAYDDEAKLDRYHELIKQGMDPDDAEVEVFNNEGDEDLDEDTMEEGNEFSGALAAAKAAGAKEFEVGGKKYTVKEDINLNVTANGEDVIGLIRKLAGMAGAETEQDVSVVELPQDAATAMAQGIIEPVEVEVDEERDIEHANTPHEQVAGLDAAIPSGTDLNRSKHQDPATANKAANPLAVKEESLWKAYEDMLGEIKK